MDAPRCLVVGLDGSARGADAMTWATQHVRAGGWQIIGVHVLTYSIELFNDLPPVGTTQWRARMRHLLQTEWIEPAVVAGVPVRTELVENDSVANGLMEASRRVGAELIVLGARGRGDFLDRLLGSVSYSVSHAAHRPVVVVPEGWTPVADPGTPTVGSPSPPAG